MTSILRILWLWAFLSTCMAYDSENDSNESYLMVTDTTTSPPGGVVDVDFGYLNPGGNATCRAKCKNYFAGAHSSDAFVCQKQASGVGTSQQNVEKGVTCFPAYGCGKDMITCVNQDWKGTLPDPTDASTACAGLDSLVAEQPWECGTEEEGREPCKHNQSNSAAGKWLKADGGLDCGWGSTYGNVAPGYEGSGIPATVMFEGVTSVYDCCVKAMQFENTPFEDGGAAIFFQHGRNIYGGTGDYCRVDRERLIYGNMDSSSGRSVKYAQRCGEEWGAEFYYRHSAGAADAANLHTGGRCVKEGNFSRESSFNPGSNLPAGELPEGWELPNHKCPDSPDEYGPGSGCHVTMRINTINDAEQCCKMCSSLSWLGHADIGDNADVDENGLHLNPCVAWQIVEGRCRLTRKAYFDYWNPGMTIRDSITQTDFDSTDLGNRDWRIFGRGCGDSAENCNHYSYIYHREVGVPPSSNNLTAGFRKVVKVEQDSLADTETIHIAVAVNAHNGRKDTRAAVTQGQTAVESGNGTDCGQLEIFLASEAMTTGTTGYDEFNEESAPIPVCKSECITTGQTAVFSCNLTSVTAGTSTSRRLSTPDIVVSASSVGSGYDQVDFTSMTMFKTAMPPPETVDEGDSTEGGSNGGQGSVAKVVTVSGEATLTVADAAAFVADPNARLGVQKAIASVASVEETAVTVVLSAFRRLQGRMLQGTSVKVEFTITKTVASEEEAMSKGAELVATLQSSDTSALGAAIVSEIEALSGKTYEVEVAAFTPDTEPVIADVPGEDASGSDSTGGSSGDEGSSGEGSSGDDGSTGGEQSRDESSSRFGSALSFLTFAVLPFM
eukprot:CAMPEP_0197631632 /NCGR_PEP_ID=MMETSP1338-20131121/8734_1 /TAXON_ID=43686 ORGANISM="Pelagodinium beii, Strain RCC1491" /NCGR_SAMPLE_ID=MMETSP1338 /ASSEMBLY_ACC=CAM_ASM_000754 /LENGTH=836 /DNA_ID=CAMNT_0043203135 /DNA_START=57 /DNA_END=2567 /DNA_ORIENTATION=+